MVVDVISKIPLVVFDTFFQGSDKNINYTHLHQNVFLWSLEAVYFVILPNSSQKQDTARNHKNVQESVCVLELK